MNTIIEWDRHLFSLINGEWYNSFLDAVLPLLRNKLWSIPLYIFLIFYILLKRKGNTVWWLVFAGAVPVLCDFVSSKLIKPNIFRARPCIDDEIQHLYRNLLQYCPEASSSFTSSHAANHMGMAVFFYFTLHQFMGKWAVLFFCWAGVIMYAQVYVGMHFPIDVICGGLIGGIIGSILARLYRKKYTLV